MQVQTPGHKSKDHPGAMKQDARRNHQLARDRANGGALKESVKIGQSHRMNGQLAIVGDRLNKQNPRIVVSKEFR